MINKDLALNVIDSEIKEVKDLLHSGFTTLREDFALKRTLISLYSVRQGIESITDQSQEKGKDTLTDPDDRYYEEPGSWKPVKEHVSPSGWTSY